MHGLKRVSNSRRFQTRICGAISAILFEEAASLCELFFYRRATTYTVALVFGGLLCPGVSVSSEFARAHIEVMIDQHIAMPGNDDVNPQDGTRRMVRCPDALVALRLQRIEAKRLGLTEWFIVINTPLKPTKHALEIRDGNYFPKTLLIRAGDAVMDPDYGKWKSQIESINGMTFHKMTRSSPAGIPLDAYTIRVPEPNAIEIRNGTYPDRLSYLFVVGDSCAALTDIEGAVTFPELPCDVDLPMQLQFPWQPLEKTRFESQTLKVNDKGRFKLRVTPGAENQHVIKILPRTVEAE